MILTFSKIVTRVMVGAILTLALSSCRQEEYTLDYLLEHPKVLEEELFFCSSNQVKSPEQIAQCKMIFRAQEKIKIYLDAMQTDPEKFGQRILNLETTIGQLKTACEKANNVLAAIKLKHPTPAELQAAELTSSKAQEAYEEKKQELNILLMMAGLNSPE